MHEHYERSSSDVVDTPGEADEEDSRYMVDNLLLEVLQRRKHVIKAAERTLIKNIYLCVAGVTCLCVIGGKSCLRGIWVKILCWRNTLGFFVFFPSLPSADPSWAKSKHTHTFIHTCNNSLMSTHSPCQMSNCSHSENRLFVLLLLYRCPRCNDHKKETFIESSGFTSIVWIID